MRPSDEQVRRSLAALRRAEEAERRAAAEQAEREGGDQPAREPTVLPPDVLERLLATPIIRPDAVERGRSRLASGDLEADDLAGKVIGRLVCDRLR